MKILFTVCNRTNLAHALVLADSARLHQPDSAFYVCWIDSVPLNNLPAHINLLTADQANFPAWNAMQQEYFDYELPAACRPWFALELLRLHENCTRLTFLSPSVFLNAPFDEVVSSEATFFLTVNIHKPLPHSRFLDDKRILNAGMFHSGSWTLKPSETTLRVLNWWAERTADRARFDLCNGMNTDQLWLNYVPVWVQETTQVSHAGWHYGLNSVLNRNLEIGNGQYLVDRKPLVSLDFAGLDFFDPIWSDHIGLLSHNKTFKKLFADYRVKVEEKKKMHGVKGFPEYGKVSEIKENRLFRNKFAKRLKAVSTYIDQF
ncbi:hypothetical protein [Dyadobacter sediminis]|uniref:Glycosyl transferase n=1 Tax=Dyadobacter sediminis TaxID=1493691 RepID=A0A5R9KEJ4_9BACT|nr:hypothetical protein [Dyadobacter sediminis]TLU94486.1 hypothetical protein FEM55_09635 [Dyadobacter sediminis]GGB90821.1 hypothetical protein GCM10011325_17810 [Dyadobacter sediminis]